MAIAKLAAPLAGLRGQLGGVVYSANQAGPYVRAWYRSSNPRTDLQSLVRGNLSQMGEAWQGLSSGTRSAWNTYAADAAQAKTNSLGETYYVSGWNWFCSFGSYNLRLGRAIYTGSPTNPVLGAPSISGVTIRPAASGNCQFTISLVQFPTNVAGLLFLRPAWSVAAAYSPHSKWLIWALDSPTSATVVINSEVYALFGDPQVGQRYFYTLRRVHSQGRIGAGTSGSVLVT